VGTSPRAIQGVTLRLGTRRFLRSRTMPDVTPLIDSRRMYGAHAELLKDSLRGRALLRIPTASYFRAEGSCVAQEPVQSVGVQVEIAALTRVPAGERVTRNRTRMTSFEDESRSPG
jgi:hypothetical protein